MELMIDHVYLRKSPYNPIVENLENSQVGENLHTNRMMHPSSTGTEAPGLDLALCISLSGCLSVSFIVSFNKLVDTSVSLSSVTSSILIKPEEGIVGTSNL